MFEAGKHYKTKNGSKVRYSSTDEMICVFEVVIGSGEWHEGDVFYTQLNGLSWVADGGLDIVGPWVKDKDGEEANK